MTNRLAQLSALLLAVLLLLAVVPLAPRLPDISQDSAWQYALNQAVADGLAFGRDVIFNLGPWGAVYTGQFHPATDGLMLGGAALEAAALAAGLLVLAHGWRRWAMLLAPLVIAVDALRDPAFIVTPLLLLAVAVAVAWPRRPHGRSGMVALALLTAACALLTLIKATFGTQAIPLTALALGVLALRGRWRLAGGLLALYAATLAGGWLLAGQRLVMLPTYLGTTRLLISGYTEGGALDGPWSEIAAYLGLCLLLAGLLWRDRARPACAAGALLGTGLAFTLFVAFKAGFVRHDAHALIALGSLCLAILAVADALRAASLALALAASLAALGVIGERYAWVHALSVSRGEALLAGAARGGWERITDPGGLARRFGSDLAAIRAAAPLPRGAGPADIYPTGQTMLLANGLQWSPRPALQSVTAFSAAMDQADLDHLQGVAPRNETGRAPVAQVFFGIGYDDNRLPALEDGLSWPALLSAFAVRGYDNNLDVAWLERRPGVPAATPDGTPLLAGQFPVGRPIALDALRAAPPGLIWAVIDIRPTLLGRIAALLFRPPILQLTLRDADGREQAFRLLSGPARAGFLLAPLVRDTTDFLALMLPERGSARARPVMLSVSGEHGTRWLWGSSFAMVLRRLVIPPQAAVRPLLLATPVADPPGLANTEDAGMPADCALDEIDGRPPSDAPLAVAGSVRVRGWAVVSGDRGEPPEQVFIRVTDADGRALHAPVTPSERPDVARHFGQPGLTRSGVNAAIDLSRLSGPAMLALEAVRGGRRFVCPTRQRLLIGAD